MGAAYFYQLRRPLGAALAPLLGRATAQGWRVAVRGTDADRLRDLDEALWTDPPESFLPHGMEGEPRDAEQPVLLTLGAGVGAFQCLMAVHGARVGADEARALERCCVLFDEAETPGARALWKDLTGAGVPAQYWAEEGGRWQKKAEA